MLHHLKHHGRRGVIHFNLNLRLFLEAAPLAFATPPPGPIFAPASTRIPPLRYRLLPRQHTEQAQRSVRSLVPYKIRCFIKALFNYGAWNFIRIACELQQPRETVRRVCLESETPVSRYITCGHKSFYTSPVMRRFINELQRSPSARRLNFTALAYRVGCTASNSMVSRYLKRHGFHRCRAKVKLFLKEVTRQKRLEFAQAHAYWDAVD